MKNSNFEYKKKIEILYGHMSVIYLFLGMCIYLFFRDLNNLMFLNWIQGIVFYKSLHIQLASSHFSYVLLYNIPDMLWFLSGILFFRFFLFNKIRKQYIYIICFYIIGFVFELFQLLNIIPGTFDVLDLIFMCIGASVEGLLYNTFVRRRFV